MLNSYFLVSFLVIKPSYYSFDVCTCLTQSGALFDRVFNTYKLMHTYQTLDFVKQKVGKIIKY